MPDRREYAGGAQSTTLAGSLAQGALSLTLADASGWPTGSVGPFFAVVGRGQDDEEKILCSARTGTSVTVVTRGADGTTDIAHAFGAAVEHCYTATDADEANAHTSASAGVHGLGSGVAVVGTTATQTLTNKTISGAANTLTNIAQSSVTNLTANLASINAEIDTLPTNDSTDTLTNKTISGADNTLTNIPQSAVPALANMTPVEFYFAGPGEDMDTGWTLGSPGGTFTAPPSGRVIVHHTATLNNSTVGVTWTAFRIYTGSATTDPVFLDGTTDSAYAMYAECTAGSGAGTQSGSYLITGLTPGGTYRVQEAHRVSAGAGQYSNIRLTVDPKL